MQKNFKKAKKGNIALIGMAGVGKSFFGKHLAEKIGYSYIETDRLMNCETGKIGAKKEQLSDNEFIRMEENVILSLGKKKNSVIDTGGSVIYSKKAMESLKSNALVIFLKDSAESIKKRFEARGESHLVRIAKKSFEDLFQERNGLYEKYADWVVEMSDSKNLQDILDEMISRIRP